MTANERESEMLTKFRSFPPQRRAFLISHVRRWETRLMTEAESKEMIRRDLAAEITVIADFASRALPADAPHAGGASDAGLLLVIGQMEAIDREADMVFDAADQAPSDSAEERRLTNQGEALVGEWNERRRTAVMTPALTLEGMQAKARHLAFTRLNLIIDNNPLYDEEIFWSLLRDGLRLTGGST
jgi:hypothetical protein